MITTEIIHSQPAKEKSFDSIITRMLKMPMKQIAHAAEQDLIQETRSHGWRRFVSTIHGLELTDDTAAVYLEDKVMDIAGYLHRETARHMVKPVNKKALHWQMKGKDYFSKGHMVSGIKATNWWRLYEKTKEKINNIITEHIAKAQGIK